MIGGGKMPTPKSMYERPDLTPGMRELEIGLRKPYHHPDPRNWGPCGKILAVEFYKYVRSDDMTAEEALKTARRRFSEEIYDEEFVE